MKAGKPLLDKPFRPLAGVRARTDYGIRVWMTWST